MVSTSSIVSMGDVAAARATLTEDYRGFHIAVAASRRVTGAILVTTTLKGGPDQLQRFFCLHSTEPDVDQACGAAAAELRRVIDDLLTAR